MTLPIVLSAIALKLLADTAYDYIYPPPLADGTLPTEPLDSRAPYTPLFVGGQCLGLYAVSLRVVSKWKPKFFSPPYSPPSNPVAGIDTFTQNVQGKILGIYSRVNPDESYSYGIRSTNGDVEYGGGSGSNYYHELSIVQIVGLNGNTDNCGSLPNPDTSEPQKIPNGAVPTSITPVVTGGDKLVEGGLPVLFTPSVLTTLISLAAQIGQSIANAQAASDALTAAKAIADAVDKLAKMVDSQKDTLDKLRKDLDKKDKQDDAKKQYFVRQYGTIVRDGYLDVVPRPAPEGFQPLMLDFLCANVPDGLGRFFGLKSYNWFRYKELGHICFLSPTSGVLSIHKIEHVRTSIPIPPLAIGFTYNMGLDGMIRARVSMLYTQEKT